MNHTAIVGYAKRQLGRKHPVAVALTSFFASHWRSGMALCALLLLAALPAMAQLAIVTLFTDTNSTDGSGNPGLGAGYIDPSGNMDLRYVLNSVIAYGGTWTIKFSSACTVTTPCTITLTNPLPPITSKSAHPLVLTIDGGEFGEVIIDGASELGHAYRAFFVDDAKVMLANLQIQNALAQGGNGGEGQWLGGGGGAGLGAGVFVNQSSANLSVQNTYFLNCQVVGGNGGNGDNDFAGGGSGGGGGMAFSGGGVGCWVTCGTPYAFGGGGGGILSAGSGSGTLNGGAGGNGGGGGGGDGTNWATPYAYGGSAYGDNSAGSTNPGTENGANGGFGGGGGGAGENIGSSLLIYAADGGNGGFGGGGGGGSESGSSNLGGFGGGNGGGTYAGVYGGAGGSAYGPSIFNNTGTITIYNSGYLNDSTHTAATAGLGAGSGTTASNGSANNAAAYNLGGSISGSFPSALPATHFSVSILPTTFILNQTATITVTALDPNNNHTIAYNGTANLTVTDGDSKPITVSPTSLTFTNGVASSSALTLTTVDTDITVTATDAHWAYITGTSGDITVTRITPTAAVTLTSGTNPVFLLTPITFKATVTGAGGYSPTGTVTFYDNGAVVTSCVGVTLSSGVATCTINGPTTALTVGSDIITASYSGDADFLPLLNTASTGYSETVVDFGFVMSNPVLTVIPGQSVQYSFTVIPLSPATTYPGMITFTASGLPSGATYSFSPTSVGPCSSSCTTTVTLNVQTQLASAAQPGAGGNLAMRLAPFSLAFLLLPLAGRLRKAGRRFSRLLPILLLLVASLAAMAGMSGCGSNIGFFGQAPHTYTVGVTGATTPSTLSHTSNVTLTVE